MLAFLAYFLLPLVWLLIASTKSNEDLFDSFGLALSHFNLFTNLNDVFTHDGGDYTRGLRVREVPLPR